ncbi:MAG: bifunctional 4-hydroxy-3-methylbut-2-enyl diphosphate reductase/30S ribosomal protein S1 [Clostridia bacterium]|nr:bifunctional 4-hydroxy-3-methylbut-2-enyl diphosphate reductase/30S ribosomal protein S1 [Clostridia bacterium]
MGKTAQRITLAKTAGFCFGVDRAVKMTYDLVDSGKKVCTLGPLIHNPQVVSDLATKGVTVIDSPDEAEKDSLVIIRTHGVPSSVVDRLSDTGCEICDATCPFVKKIHRIVAAENCTVMIAGDAAHPEVEGIKGHCKSDCIVFKNTDSLLKILNENAVFCNSELIFVAQTTFSVEEWKNCKEIIKKYCTNAKIFDTICNATQDRQSEAHELSLVSDIMIIIGGRHSSNTVKLSTVCSSNCPTYLIEQPSELFDIDFSGCSSIGVTAGASTPAGIIKEVLKTMSEIVETNSVELEKAAEMAVAEEVKDTEAAQSIDDMDFSAALEESLKSMSTDQKVKGVVMGFSPTEIQVDIGRKHAGFIPIDEYSNDPTANPQKELKVGDELELIIMKTNDAEGTVMLSKKRCDAAQAWNNIIEAETDGTIFEGTVVEVIRGGVLVATNGIRVFVPASLATESKNQPLEELLRTKVRLRIIEVNKQRRRAVGSIRAVIKEERKAKSDEFWAQAAVGQVYNGTVKSLTSYGAFVDIGGIDGMVHISEMSWKRIKHPSEVFNVGDEVEVYIKALDDEKKKISLGYKKVEDNPWEILRRDYPVDSVVEAEVVSMTTFGAFARVIPGIDGLIHISQIANRHIEKPQDALNIGEKVQVKITAIDFDKKRVSLSIRALLDPMENTEVVEEVVEAAAEIDETAPDAEEAAE